MRARARDDRATAWLKQLERQLGQARWRSLASPARARLLASALRGGSENKKRLACTAGGGVAGGGAARMAALRAARGAVGLRLAADGGGGAARAGGGGGGEESRYDQLMGASLTGVARWRRRRAARCAIKPAPGARGEVRDRAGAGELRRGATPSRSTATGRGWWRR